MFFSVFFFYDISLSISRSNQYEKLFPLGAIVSVAKTPNNKEKTQHEQKRKERKVFSQPIISSSKT